MLFGLERRAAKIVREAQSEAEVYGDRRLYYGDKPGQPTSGAFYCPICGLSARRFLRFGLAGRRNARCPHCGSLERHRLLWLYLTRYTDLMRRRTRLLHTAPEPCMTAALTGLRNLRRTTVDRFDRDADVGADLTDLPFPNGRFDVVLSCHVLEHIPDDAAAMGELARVLRPGGWAAIMVPYDPGRHETDEGRHIASPAERLARFGHPYHYRIYGADLAARLTRAGFHVEELSSRQLLTPHLHRRYRINRNHLFLCTRTAHARSPAQDPL